MSDAVTLTLRRMVLDALQQTPGDEHEPCAFGFAVHRRDHGGVPVFGVVTAAGETLPLTGRMLGDLRALPCRLRGGTPVTLQAPPGAEALPDAPLAVLWVELWRPGPTGELLRVGYPVSAAGFDSVQVLLAWRRPDSWPA